MHYVKRPGAVLDAGAIVARLQLDDPSRVQQVCIANMATIITGLLIAIVAKDTLRLELMVHCFISV